MYAYQVIRAETTTFEVSSSISLTGRNVTRDPAKAEIMRPVEIMPIMIFAVRFATSFKVTERKAMINGTTNTIETTSVSATSPDII